MGASLLALAKSIYYIIPIDFESLFASCKIWAFQSRFSSRATLRKAVSLTCSVCLLSI